MENNLTFIVITLFLGIVGSLITLMGLSELKSTIKSDKLNDTHKKYHSVLIILPILIPILFGISEWKNDRLIHLFNSGTWTIYLLYNIFVFYLLVHFRSERKDEYDDELSFSKGAKIMFLKLLDLFR